MGVNTLQKRFAGAGTAKTSFCQKRYGSQYTAKKVSWVTGKLLTFFHSVWLISGEISATGFKPGFTAHGIIESLSEFGPSSQIHCPWLGDRIDSGIGCRSAAPILCSQASRKDNPMPESTLSSQSGTMSLATACIKPLGQNGLNPARYLHHKTILSLILLCVFNNDMTAW